MSNNDEPVMMPRKSKVKHITDNERAPAMAIITMLAYI